MSIGPRDMLANLKGSSNAAWESTTDALNFLPANSLNMQFRTNSFARSPTQRSKKRPSQPDSHGEENFSPSQLNSPPQARSGKQKDEEMWSASAVMIERKRISNPTRSPAVRRNTDGASVAIPDSQQPPPPEVVPVVPQSALPMPTMVPPLKLDEISSSSVSDPSSCDSPRTPGSESKRGSRKGPFGSMKKQRTGKPGKDGGENSPSGKDTPTKMRMKWATAHREKIQGLRDRGSSDQIIRGSGDFRSAACTELKETEERFLRRLDAAQEVHEAILRDGTILTEEEARCLFGNLKAIRMLSSKLSADLSACMKDFKATSTLVAPVLLAHLPFMRIYAEYLISYGNAQEIFGRIKDKKKLTQLLEKMRGFAVPNGANVQDLQNWLAEPFQRITRYPVLLLEILKHTPSDHPDRQGLEQALEGCKQLVQTINEDVRKSEQRSMYLKVKNMFHPVDAGNLEDDRGDKTRALRFDGIMKMLPEVDLQFRGFESESSTDRLLDELDHMIASHRQGIPTPEPRAEPAKVEVSYLSPYLDPTLVPQKKTSVEMDSDLKKLRQAEQDDSFDDSDVDSGERAIFLCDDVLILAFQEGKYLCIDAVLPLELSWVVTGPSCRDSLVLVWPGGTRRMVVDETLTRTIAVNGLPARQMTSVRDWQSHIAQAIEARCASEFASAKRASCKIAVEDDGSIVVEEKLVKKAQEHAVDEISLLDMALLAQRKPNKKRTIMSRLGM